ncbi:hypothetical protein [Polyangium aurulentum]|uniref:hypothetical protein n=1 Tax=Polyangium aurulentum TaxID=2567896 RepID=UPI0010AED8D8|nr:hypothetical protein [Polyangium aurulentum]UQA56085.1 hypothetical protein E8A73_032865 [Polyangium aurulentum]
MTSRGSSHAGAGGRILARRVLALGMLVSTLALGFAASGEAPSPEVASVRAEEVDAGCAWAPEACDSDPKDGKNETCACGYVCIDKACFKPPRCTKDIHCGPERQCIGAGTSGGTCSCLVDTDCGAMAVCEGQKCIQTCVADADCPSGYICLEATNRCALPDCQSDDDCPVSYCDQDLGRCTAPGSCLTNYHCRAGRANGALDSADTGTLVCSHENVCVHAILEEDAVAGCAARAPSDRASAGAAGLLVGLAAARWLGRARRRRAFRA